MTQDTLYIRDAVSKTITVSPVMMTITGEYDGDEFVIPDKFAGDVRAMFEYAYNRADEFAESARGVSLEISGGAHPERIGDKAQAIYNEVTGAA